jgi:subtilase family serine protease
VSALAKRLAVTVPLAIAPLVLGLSVPVSAAPSDPKGLGANDLARAYALPDASVGTKGTVAIVTAGAYPKLESDLATYRHQYGLPDCTTANGCLHITDYHGGPPVPAGSSDQDREAEEDWAKEAALDVDMASAACPGCRIMVVQTPDIDATGEPSPEEKATDYGIAVNTAVKQGATVVSISDMLGLDASTAEGPIGKALYHPGVPVFASIGDGGEAPPTPEMKAKADAPGEKYMFPAGLPWVVSVGGTKLQPTDATKTKFTETAWPGLGGTCTQAFGPAEGQPASIAAHCGGHRAGADISAIADPYFGPAVYNSYAPSSGKPDGWSVSGGTSASSPFVAAWYARSKHGTTDLGPSALYRAPAGTFTDVTSGGESPDTCVQLHWSPVMCQAGQGWDGPTGLGSPHGLGDF